MRLIRTGILAALPLVSIAAATSAREVVGLNGPWRFAIDPTRAGEQLGWQQPALNTRNWTEVEVPHCWPVDPRFPYTGTAWYRKAFDLPASASGRHARLVFHGVFYLSKVWLNGHLLGKHEGGYTPFEFDATSSIRPGTANSFVVEVDDSWSTSTLPGARPGPEPQNQVYPWWDYGGIVRPVELILTDAVHLGSQRVITAVEPDGGAAVEIATAVVNASDKPATVRLALDIAGLKNPSAIGNGTASVSVGSHESRDLKIRITIPRQSVRLWDQDHPHLYKVHARLWRDQNELSDEADTAVFGIRKVEVSGTRLLLNSEPIRMGGANRHCDDPRFGLIEPESVIARDMAQMLNANMQLARIIHYPVSDTQLDWADRNGFLIIEEGPNWQLAPEQMDNPEIRAKFQSQVREMIERDRNHPSIIGWSVGNEYASESPSGQSWTRDMIAYVRSLDNTRLLTFASNRAYRDNIASAEGEASQYVDLICVNLSSADSIGKRLDMVHSRWPAKPIFVSEFGAYRDTGLPDERARADYLAQQIEAVRRRPFVVGCSLWTYNDYRSRFPPGTYPDGYRHKGVVTAARAPRETYYTVAQEFSPVLITEAKASTTGGRVAVRANIRVRSDFPSYVLRDYEVRLELLDSAGRTLGTQKDKLPELNPGGSKAVQFEVAGIRATAARISVVRPTGFVTAAEIIKW